MASVPDRAKNPARVHNPGTEGILWQKEAMHKVHDPREGVLWDKSHQTKEEIDERDSKMLSKYGQDAIDSNKEHEARHAAEKAEFEGK
jgi:hypothetical protein